MTSPTYQCTVVACVGAKTELVTEWLAYHAAVGVEHVYLYCNDEDPAPLHATLLPFLVGPSPFVTFLHFPFPGQQRLAYLHFLRTRARHSAWVTFLEVDDFLYLPRDGTVASLLGRLADRVDVLYLNWLVLGSSDGATGDGRLETFTQHAPTLHPYTKVIVRTDAIDLAAISRWAGNFWHDWPATYPELRRLNVFGDTADEYFADFPRGAQAYLRAPGMLEHALAEAVICRLPATPEGEEAMAPEPFTGLRDIWRGLHDPARIPSVLGQPPGSNLALHQPAQQSSVSPWSLHETTELDAAGAVSGHVTGRHQFHTAMEDNPWWQVDLGGPCAIWQIMVFNRLDHGQDRLKTLVISVGAHPDRLVEVFRKSDAALIGGLDGFPLRLVGDGTLVARFVRVGLVGRGFLHLDQVEVYGAAAPA